MLIKICRCILHGWPKQVGGEKLKPYDTNRNGLSLEEDMIVWGYRVVISKLLRGSLLNEFPNGQMGTLKINDCVTFDDQTWILTLKI